MGGDVIASGLQSSCLDVSRGGSGCAGAPRRRFSTCFSMAAHVTRRVVDHLLLFDRWHLSFPERFRGLRSFPHFPPLKYLLLLFLSAPSSETTPLHATNSSLRSFGLNRPSQSPSTVLKALDIPRPHAYFFPLLWCNLTGGALASSPRGVPCATGFWRVS